MGAPSSIDCGAGFPVVLIPGLPGRWEWLRPAVDALARHFRVLSFSLTDLPVAGFFDRAVDRVDDLLAVAGETRAVVAGVSFGGLVAAHYASRRPRAVSRLVLASTPSPRWQLSRHEAACIRRPVLTLPLFVARGANRLLPELLAALPTWSTRTAFARYYATVALRRPGSPRKMAAWVRLWMESDIAAECHRIQAPTLVVTGEPHLDRVVPVASSLDYLRLVPDARHVVMPGTGHLGSVVQPTAFAEVLRAFASAPQGRGAEAPLYVEAAPRIH